MMPSAPAVFVDRDGTLVREIDYLADPEQLSLLPGAVQALRRLCQAGYRVVVTTNQSGVARGWISEHDLQAVHARLRRLCEEGGVNLAGIYACPHHPDQGPAAYRTRCDCRKPRPGLLLRAAAALHLDLSASWTIGDAERDLLAGQAAGVRTILVATGKGAREYERLCARGTPPLRYVRDLEEAADCILAEARAQRVLDEGPSWN